MSQERLVGLATTSIDMQNTDIENIMQDFAGSDLDGDEYHVMWIGELIFERDNYPPMHFTVKDKAKELERPVMVSIY
ncbi:hypothetical protein AVEN_56314-1 [Araneus ventricosus]|uniref:RNA-dependent RNA polymerase n=1 Tax=Araneus ventricosus TaxID=182803 RepID=A0A4Y2V771_ARAVE|nr:hypothetical protein AVEN_56314-1 [Araneus ventricosus]